MKTTRWFTRPTLSYLRIAVAGTLLSAALAMAFVAAKTSGPLLSAKSGGKPEANSVRSKAFGRHFQTLLGPAKEKNGEGSRVDGAAQEDYDNRAYPATYVQPAQQQAAAR